MSMSPRYHVSVPMISTSQSDIASTPLVKALLQTFRRRGFPKEIQTDEKLGIYYALRMPFTFKNAFNYFSRVMPELPREYKKFDLLCLDNVVIFSENGDYPINNINKILEENARLTIEPVKRKFVQDGVKYLGHVVGIERRSPSQLKVETIRVFPISRNKTEVKVLGLAGYDRQHIPKFSRLVTTVTETLKRKSKKRDLIWTSECPEFFRQLKENLSTNSVLYAPNLTKLFTFQPETIFYLFSFVCRA
ncbi:retrovirus-related Pol polyprotein from transposon 297 [Trichonephila inaurata madagascariensis]|uniref:Retrovirus-related Pol polyprotein from transposon 297 n=1 Tax=Trichonephila inaurata madagascariensis TaxID=2747483 RepID=A0A8X6X1J0_9ARAC|nr:retrovirus-related Pol polyprotein from transposon 297 [Trichonephila inaurata madagascariensis]